MMDAFCQGGVGPGGEDRQRKMWCLFDGPRFVPKRRRGFGQDWHLL